jgi:hypothetical protein
VCVVLLCCCLLCCCVCCCAAVLPCCCAAVLLCCCAAVLLCVGVARLRCYPIPCTLDPRHSALSPSAISAHDFNCRLRVSYSRAARVLIVHCREAVGAPRLCPSRLISPGVDRKSADSNDRSISSAERRCFLASKFFGSERNGGRGLR